MVAFQKEPLVPRTSRKDEPIVKEKEVTTTDANIQLPAYVLLTEHYLIKKETHMYSICFRLI